MKTKTYNLVNLVEQEELDALTAGYEALPARLLELATMCDWAAAREALAVGRCAAVAKTAVS